MNKTRLEAFSDGVIAIIITIMVLEFKVPHNGEWHALEPLIPTFLCYGLSFIYVGIYWNNHHHMLHTVKHISGTIMWSNLNLLFWLSLVPFTTAWMGENHFERAPVAVYSTVLLMCGAAYDILRRFIIHSHPHDHDVQKLLEHQRTKGLLSVLSCVLAIGLSFFYPMASIVLIAGVAIIWFIPDKEIERTARE